MQPLLGSRENLSFILVRIILTVPTRPMSPVSLCTCLSLRPLLPSYLFQFSFPLLPHCSILLHVNACMESSSCYPQTENIILPHSHTHWRYWKHHALLPWWNGASSHPACLPPFCFSLPRWIRCFLCFLFFLPLSLSPPGSYLRGHKATAQRGGSVLTGC